MRIARSSSVVALMAVALLALLGVTPAAAQTARIERIDRLSDRHLVVHVYSPSMNRVIPNDVLLPPGGGAAPTFYLLNGVDGGEAGRSWFASTSLLSFFADKRVNVVSPIGGRYSLYTDWQRPDPVLGANMWQTYLTDELPAVIDGAFGGTGRNAIGGLSLSGGSALDLAVQAPGLYDAAASYSGCPRFSAPDGVALTTAIVGFGGGNVGNAWGPPGGPQWAQHDAFLNAERLRGTAIYLSSASGMPGPADAQGLAAVSLLFGPSVIEAYTDGCTRAFAGELDRLGIPATYERMPTGAHTWGLFDAQMRDSWRVIGPALGA
jgi:diacylglycerol O-acyltransferase/trehalose O-mycolyltransferase